MMKVAQVDEIDEEEQSSLDILSDAGRADRITELGYCLVCRLYP